MKQLLKKLKKADPIIFEQLRFTWGEFYALLIHSLTCISCKKYKKGDQIKINFGSSGTLKEGFLNVDFSPKADIRLDLRRRLPFSDQCAQSIFSEHFIEHLPYPECAVNFFDDCYRILEDGGKMIVSVPDAEWILKAYANEDPQFLEVFKSASWIPDEFSTRMDKINYVFRQRCREMSYSHFENHRYCYDFETLAYRLKEAGFKTVKKREYDPAIDAEHRQDGVLGLRIIAEK